MEFGQKSLFLPISDTSSSTSSSPQITSQLAPLSAFSTVFHILNWLLPVLVVKIWPLEICAFPDAAAAPCNACPLAPFDKRFISNNVMRGCIPMLLTNKYFPSLEIVVGASLDKTNLGSTVSFGIPFQI